MVENKTRIGEEKQAAASYVLTFYQEVQQMTAQYAGYCNVLLEQEHKYKDLDLGKMDDDTKARIMQEVQTVRFYVHTSYIRYLSIMEGVKQKVDKEVKELYEDVNKQFILERSVLERYVVALNKVLTTKIMKGLLESSTDIVENVYGV